MVHPSDGIVAVPRYVTPSADTYRIVTAVARYGGNNGLTRFTLVVNGSIVFAEDCTLGYAYQPIHTESLTLPGGSLIDLTVDRGDAFLGHDSTGLRAGIYAQSLIESIAASSIETTEGVEFEGSVASVGSSDNSYYSALSDDTTLSATVEAHGTTTVIDPTCIWMNYESRAGRPGLAEEVSFYDFLASQWVSVAGRVAPISDQSAIAIVLQNTARFKSGIGLLGAKIRWSPVNDEDPAQDGWLLSLDTLSWEAAH